MWKGCNRKVVEGSALCSRHLKEVTAVSESTVNSFLKGLPSALVVGAAGNAVYEAIKAILDSGFFNSGPYPVDLQNAAGRAATTNDIDPVLKELRPAFGPDYEPFLTYLKRALVFPYTTSTNSFRYHD